MKKNMHMLLTDIDVFGLCYYGDGATVNKMLLINILACGVHCPVAVLEIVDCSNKVSEGGKKDAKYISSLFRPHIESVERLKPNTTDVLYFDGASNVQLAGNLIGVKYPCVITLHGAEHVIALFFSDVFRFPEVNALYQIAKRTYKIFGSGAQHQPYAIFQKYSKRHNDGKTLNGRSSNCTCSFHPITTSTC